MNITTTRTALLGPLTHVAAAVAKKTLIPILDNVALRASGDTLSLTCTDLDLMISEPVQAKVLKAGATTVPASTMLGIIKKLPDDASITIEGGDNHVTIKSGRSKFKLSALPISDYPSIDAASDCVNFDIDAADLRKMFKMTKIAVSTAETMYYLNGVYLHIEPASRDKSAELRAVATDGHRLARVSREVPPGGIGMPGIIIPSKTIAAISRLLDDAAGAVSVSVGATQIRFVVSNVSITSKLIDGTFPDYERVIPTGNNNVLEVNSKELLSSVSRVTVVSDEKTRAIKIVARNNAIDISAVGSSGSGNEAIEEIDVSYNGNSIEIGFNSLYVIDALSHVSGDTVRITIGDAVTPALFYDVSDPGVLFVVMPMRI